MRIVDWIGAGRAAAIAAGAVVAACGSVPGPAPEGTVVRSSDVLDGPYADTKEQFAGYFFVEATDLDEAVAWAKRCPASRFGAIEIRPVHVPKGDWK